MQCVLCAETEQLSRLAPSNCPHLLLQAVAGPMAAATASTLTNPMDVVRARVQVNTPPVWELHRAVIFYPLERNKTL